MNILVIGNGFDLAHGLPTKYGDFLEWIKVTRKMIDKGYSLEEEDWENVDTRIRSFMEDMLEWHNCPFFLAEPWKDMIRNNILIDYFMRSKTYQEKSWVDFEAEISNLIQVLEVIEEKMDEGGLFNNLRKSQKKIITQLFPKFSIKRILVETLKSIGPISHIDNLEDILDTLDIYKIFEKEIEKIFGDMNNLRCDLEKSLDELILLLEQYLLHFCLKFEINQNSPDIRKIDISKVISFNYTDIYQKVYVNEGGETEVEYDYIHGRVQNNGEDNNMVLGISEYLSNDEKNCNIKFIAFKKYYQRIHKETGNKYKNWIDIIKEDEKSLKRELEKEFPSQIPIQNYNDDKRHNLYIFGHSLDVTDKDILRDLILNDNVYTTIYYCKTKGKNGQYDNGRIDLSSKIKNLVKVIGQDELIRRIGGSTKTIEFKLQQDMVEKE